MANDGIPVDATSVDVDVDIAMRRRGTEIIALAACVAQINSIFFVFAFIVLDGLLLTIGNGE